MAKFLKILAIVTVVMVVGIAILLAIDLAWTMIATAVGTLLGVPQLGAISGIWVALALAFFLPKDWIWHRLGFGGPYVCHASCDMDAPVAEVWDMYRLRPRDDYYAVTMPTVVAGDGPGRFDLITDSRLCADGDVPKRVSMQVEEQIEEFYIRMRPLNAHELPLFGKDLETTEIWMERVDHKTRVTYAENLSRLTWVAALAFLFLNPAKDGLKQVQARVEGREDTSWMTRAMRDVGPDGQAIGAARQTSVMVMISVTLVTAVLLFGVVRLALSFSI